MSVHRNPLEKAAKFCHVTHNEKGLFQRFLSAIGSHVCFHHILCHKINASAILEYFGNLVEGFLSRCTILKEKKPLVMSFAQ